MRWQVRPGQGADLPLSQLIAALERVSEEADPRPLHQLLGSLERLKAMAWERLLRHIHDHAMPELVLRQSA